MTPDVAFQVRNTPRGPCSRHRGGDMGYIKTRVNGLANIRAAAGDA